MMAYWYFIISKDDDLRQDAIMTQVFTYVNGLMMRRSSDRHRTNRLKIVTYNVLPMSPQTGVSFFVLDYDSIISSDIYVPF